VQSLLQPGVEPEVKAVSDSVSNVRQEVSTTINGAQALFKALTDAGLDTSFANPGTSEMQLVYEMG